MKTNKHIDPPFFEALLQHDNSITELITSLGHTAEVIPFSKNWQQNTSRDSELQYEREVTMLVNNSPAWYAKTILSEGAYKNLETSFRQLGNKAIGCILFSKENNIHRIGLKYGQVSLESPLRSQLSKRYSCADNAPLVERRSQFLLLGESIQLVEVFLPGIMELLCTNG